MEKIKRHITTLEKQYGRKPTVFEISAASFFSPEKVREILLIEQTYIQPVSLNRKINAADDDSAETIDLVASTIPSPHEIIAEKAQNKYLYSLLRKYLLPMDFIVIYYRFGLNGDQSLTLEEIAKKYGITRERVRQREARALKRLAKIPAIQDIFTQETNKSISDQTEVKKTSRSRSAGKVHSKKTARLSTEQLDSTLLDAEEEYA